MKYKKLIEFCELLLETRLPTVLAEKHVKPDGIILITMLKVVDAIIMEKDFDFRAFMQEMVDYAETLSEMGNRGKLLN
jgi:hypothetical protein